MGHTFSIRDWTAVNRQVHPFYGARVSRNHSVVALAEEAWHCLASQERCHLDGSLCLCTIQLYASISMVPSQYYGSLCLCTIQLYASMSMVPLQYCKLPLLFAKMHLNTRTDVCFCTCRW